MNTLLKSEQLCKRYGELQVTDGVSLDIRSRELHAIIGPNGAGKTTLINQLSGELTPDSGAIHFDGVDVTRLPIHRRARMGLLRSYQITSIFEAFSVRENLSLAALGPRDHAFRFLKPLVRHADAAAVTAEILQLSGLGEIADTPAGELGYGERRQLELAMALAAKPKLLLLDEPMAGMSSQESAEVIRLLQQLKGRYSILLIEHDMDAVFALADRISVLVYGSILCTRTPDEIRAHPDVQAMYLGDETL